MSLDQRRASSSRTLVLRVSLQVVLGGPTADSLFVQDKSVAVIAPRTHNTSPVNRYKSNHHSAVPWGLCSRNKGCAKGIAFHPFHSKLTKARMWNVQHGSLPLCPSELLVKGFTVQSANLKCNEPVQTEGDGVFCHT